MVVVLANTKPPSVRGSIAMAVVALVILELIPRLARQAVGMSGHLRFTIVAILIGVAYYMLPRLPLSQSIPWAYQFGTILVIAVFSMITLVWEVWKHVRGRVLRH
jgi:type VI protein secretion system component VasK